MVFKHMAVLILYFTDTLEPSTAAKCIHKHNTDTNIHRNTAVILYHLD